MKESEWEIDFCDTNYISQIFPQSGICSWRLPVLLQRVSHIAFENEWGQQFKAQSQATCRCPARAEGWWPYWLRRRRRKAEAAAPPAEAEAAGAAGAAKAGGAAEQQEQV